MRFLSLLLLFSFYTVSAFSASELAPTFTLSGKLFESLTSDVPLEESNIELQIEILDAARTCVLYHERQIISTVGSQGAYSVEVGSLASDTTKRVAMTDPGNSMAEIFQNTTTIPATCPANTSPAVSSSGRYLRITVTPDLGTPEIMSPEIFIGSVPTALVAETLGGLTKDQFAKLGSGLTQSQFSTIFSSTSYPILNSIITSNGASTSGTNSSDYVLTAGGSGAIQFITGSTLKAEITNAGHLEFNGSSAKTLGLLRETTPNAAGKPLTISSGGSAIGSTDQAGGDLVLASGISTGLNGSNIFFQTPTPSTSGTGSNLPANKMILDPRGNLGIGSLQPVAKMDVAGQTWIRESSAGGLSSTAGKGLKLEYSISTDNAVIQAYDYTNTLAKSLALNPGGGNVGIGLVSATEKLEVSGNVKATTFLYTSDRRLKKEIQTLHQSASLVERLRGVSFRWNESNEKTLGFIAQEVEKVIPELVRTDQRSGLKSVQYANVVALLVEAFKEERKEKEILENRLKRLEVRFEQLERQMDGK